MKRPTIKSPCVADRYCDRTERIAEFNTPSGKGGLFRVRQSGDGKVIAEVYRTDPEIIVIAPHNAADEAARAMLVALKQTDKLMSGSRGQRHWPDLEAIRFAIAQAEAAGIK